MSLTAKLFKIGSDCPMALTEAQPSDIDETQGGEQKLEVGHQSLLRRFDSSTPDPPLLSS